MSFTTRQQTHTRRGQGKGFHLPAVFAGTNVTAAAIGSGGLTLNFAPNTVGSTLPSTMIGLPFPPAPSVGLRPVVSVAGTPIARGFSLVRIYKIGTLNLTATGNQFTHDSATFPLLRTEFGESSKPISLIPVIQVTTALTTTAAVLRLRNNTGPASGYTNQDGAGVTGTRDFTFPSATTAAHSSYIPMLEDGDSGVRDISNIDVTTAASAGAATVWGMELLLPMTFVAATIGAAVDALVSGFMSSCMTPAVPTGGSVTSLLLGVSWASSNNVVHAMIEGVSDE